MVRLAALVVARFGLCIAEEAMHFLAIGDWGGSSPSKPVTPAEESNAAGMAAFAKSLGGVRFVLAEGDNFYSHGLNGDEHCQRFQDGFENVFTQSELQVPFYAIAGNHDHKGNVTAQVAYTHDSKRWTYPDYWYDFTESFTMSNGSKVTTQIVQIDTVTISGMSDEDVGSLFHPHHMQAKLGEQMQWLEETLAASTADYLWIGGHYPMYSQCKHGPTVNIINTVLPLMRKYNVNGFIAGHDHCLGHYTQDGMAFVLSGAGKATSYTPSNLNNTANAGVLKFRMDGGETHGAKAGFASFTATVANTTIRYHNQDGEVLYVADVVKPRSKTPSPIPTTASSPTVWDCQLNRKSKLVGDSNLKRTGDDRATCTSKCEQTSGCVAVNWHKTENHCRINVGSFTQDDFMASLVTSGEWDSCFASGSELVV